jgi:hypothetical protein
MGKTPSILPASAILAVLLSTGATHAAGTLPGAPGVNFDLSHWTLQLPVASNGSVLQITGDKLEGGYASEYFQSGADGSMVFWCPVTGGTTPNSHYPRSELRETPAGGDWKLSGDHELRATLRILAVPSNGRLILGQIHGHVDESEIIKLLWDNGKLSAAVEPNRSSGEVQLALGSYKIGDTIDYAIHMKAGMLEVRAGTKTVKYDYTAATWQTDTYYFKAGAYVQDDAGSSSEGGKAAFYSLQTFPLTVAIGLPREGTAQRSGRPAMDASGGRVGFLREDGRRFDDRRFDDRRFDGRGRAYAAIHLRQ